jgi:hypothetical protein
LISIFLKIVSVYVTQKGFRFMPQLEAIQIIRPNIKELEEMGIDGSDPQIQQHLTERASLISVLKRDQLRLTKEVGVLGESTMPMKLARRDSLNRQLSGLDVRLRNAIVLDFS